MKTAEAAPKIVVTIILTTEKVCVKAPIIIFV
jgi:hypothetical protein